MLPANHICSERVGPPNSRPKQTLEAQLGAALEQTLQNFCYQPRIQKYSLEFGKFRTRWYTRELTPLLFRMRVSEWQKVFDK